MNLIDFHVTKIVSEEYDKMYKLMNKDEEYLEKQREEDPDWYEYLSSNGCKQVFEYSDDGGESVKAEYFNLDAGRKPYKVGYKGLH